LTVIRNSTAQSAARERHLVLRLEKEVASPVPKDSRMNRPTSMSGRCALSIRKYRSA
jgi:hypothetical protein